MYEGSETQLGCALVHLPGRSGIGRQPRTTLAVKIGQLAGGQWMSDCGCPHPPVSGLRCIRRMLWSALQAKHAQLIGRFSLASLRRQMK